MKIALSLVLAMALQVSVMAPAALAQPACRFVLGFATLRDLVGAQKVGQCLEDEHFNLENGNSEQHTSGGLMVWRKLDNFTAFTDGGTSWINGPNGLQSRSNDQRFSWEKDPVQTAPAPSANATARVSATPSAAASTPPPVTTGTSRSSVESAALRASDLPQGYSRTKAEWNEKGAYGVTFDADVATILRAPMRADMFLIILPNADMARQLVETQDVEGAERVTVAAVKGADASRGFQSTEVDSQFTFKVSTIVFSVGEIAGLARVQGESSVTNIGQANALAERFARRLTGGQVAAVPAFDLAALTAVAPPSRSQSSTSSITRRRQQPTESDLSVRLSAVDTMTGRTFPTVSGRACNRTSDWKASNIRIEFEFYYDSLLPTLDSGSYWVSEVGAGECRNFNASLTTLQPWRTIKIRRVTWDWG